MHTLHLIDETAADVSDIQKVRAVREAMRILHADAMTRHTGADEDDQPGAADANRAIEGMRETGAYLIGRSPDLDLLVRLADALDSQGIEAVIDFEIVDEDADDAPTPEEVFAHEAPGEVPAESSIVYDTEDGEAPERPTFIDAEHETAMALLAHAKGDPIKAAAFAHTLGRVTEDEDLYVGVINALIYVFPWIAGPLEQSGMIVF